ncbi:MAG TPA: hypothetical protein VGP33_02645, partial [Chloroflexota bacterium]|nr:hypothetical protein [Chloroflexota bacterium]
EIGSGRTSVNQAVAKLRELGLIDVEDRVDEHGRTTSTYTLLDPPLFAERTGLPPREQPAARQPNSLPSMNKNHGKRDTSQEYVTGRYGSVVARQQRQQDAALEAGDA